MTSPVVPPPQPAPATTADDGFTEFTPTGGYGPKEGLKDDQILIDPDLQGPPNGSPIRLKVGDRVTIVRAMREPGLNGGISLSQSLYDSVVRCQPAPVKWARYRRRDHARLIASPAGLKVILPVVVALLTFAMFFFPAKSDTYKSLSNESATALEHLAKATPPTTASVPPPPVTISQTGQLGLSPEETLPFPVVNAETAVAQQLAAQAQTQVLVDELDRRSAEATASASAARAGFEKAAKADPFYERADFYLQVLVLLVAAMLGVIGFCSLGPGSPDE